MAELLTFAFLFQVLRISVPYALAALGGAMSERSGIVNIALEGKLLVGAFTGALGAFYTGSIVVGALCGALGGVIVAALYAVIVIRFRADQIVTGVAINMLAVGLTRLLLKWVFDSTANSPAFDGFTSGILANPVFWLAALLVPMTHVILFRTRFGLRVRAAGEHPEAADSLGVSVVGTRYRAVLFAGAVAGLGGAWLSLDNGQFTADMSNGRGYIALAAVIMGKWRPAWAVAACVFFGLADAMQINLQSTLTWLPREFIQVLPHILAMVALAGFIGKSRAPAALGKPFGD